jgi:hypothetical protein
MLARAVSSSSPQASNGQGKREKKLEKRFLEKNEGKPTSQKSDYNVKYTTENKVIQHVLYEPINAHNHISRPILIKLVGSLYKGQNEMSLFWYLFWRARVCRPLLRLCRLIFE